jgi:hypothetical protein
LNRISIVLTVLATALITAPCVRSRQPSRRCDRRNDRIRLQPRGPSRSRSTHRTTASAFVIQVRMERTISRSTVAISLCGTPTRTTIRTVYQRLVERISPSRTFESTGSTRTSHRRSTSTSRVQVPGPCESCATAASSAQAQTRTASTSASQSRRASRTRTCAWTTRRSAGRCTSTMRRTEIPRPTLCTKAREIRSTSPHQTSAALRLMFGTQASRRDPRLQRARNPGSRAFSAGRGRTRPPTRARVTTRFASTSLRGPRVVSSCGTTQLTARLMSQATRQRFQSRKTRRTPRRRG